MASLKGNTVFFSVVMMTVLHFSLATVYKVGDSAGWTIESVDYKTWASSKTFLVGDTIVFEYDPSHHNVVRVTHKQYNSCNITVTSRPFEYSSGHDSFIFKKAGHHYYACSYAGHCEAGQKVSIKVVDPAETAQSPSPSSSALAPALEPVPAALVPASVPSPSKKSNGVSHTALSAVGVVALGFAAFIGCIAY